MHITSITLPFVIKNLAWLFVSFFVSLSASIAILFYFNDTAPYLSACAVPDTPTAYLLGGFAGTVLSVLLNLTVFLYFTAFTFVLKKKIVLGSLLYHKTEKIGCKICHATGYCIMLLFFFCGVRDFTSYGKIFLSGLWFYASAIATAAFYTIIMVSLLSHQSR